MTTDKLLKELENIKSIAICCTPGSYIMDVSYDGKFAIITEGNKMIGIDELRNKLSKIPKDTVLVFDHGYLDKNNDNKEDPL